MALVAASEGGSGNKGIVAEKENRLARHIQPGSHVFPTARQLLPTAVLSVEICLHEAILTVERIELVLNDHLPPSSHVHRQWWETHSEGKQDHGRAWRD